MYNVNYISTYKGLTNSWPLPCKVMQTKWREAPPSDLDTLETKLQNQSSGITEHIFCTYEMLWNSVNI